MKESIMSFFHAPVTNKVPAGVCNLTGLHTYLTSDKQLEQLTNEVRATLADGQLFRKRSSNYCLMSHLPASFLTAKNFV